MLTSALDAPAGSSSPIGPAVADAERDRVPLRIDAIEVRLRRLVDSSEPAVVFSSLVRLCVPAFCDSCTVDVVEGGRMRYRVGYPQPEIGAVATDPGGEYSVVTAFESHLPGWASYRGVMTSRWHARRPTAADERRAAAIVDHAVGVIRDERLADPVRARLASTNEFRSQLRSC